MEVVVAQYEALSWH